MDTVQQLIFCPLCLIQLDHDLKHAHELRQAAFKLYASLGSNDEDIRKKVTSPHVYLCFYVNMHVCVYILMHLYCRLFQITETDNMMDRIVSGLSESSIKVRLAAVRYGVCV